MIKLKSNNKNIREQELDKLKKQYAENLFDLIADLILLSHTKEPLQKYLKKGSVSKEKFIPKTKKLFPLDFSQDVYETYENIKEISWNYFTFSYDNKSGFEAVAYYRKDVLAVGISGTDGGYADWVDK